METLTVKEVASLFKMNPHSIYNGICRNSKNPFPIKPVRIGRAVRFPKDRVEAFLKQDQTED
ncbi:MAG: helix-turn-helix domain-containing protein [Desulfovibrionales bacterium]|nr:helix-turn-helix domain-containing protein [Desulfovibrionales bacterium]